MWLEKLAPRSFSFKEIGLNGMARNDFSFLLRCTFLLPLSLLIYMVPFVLLYATKDKVSRS